MITFLLLVIVFGSGFLTAAVLCTRDDDDLDGYDVDLDDDEHDEDHS